MAKQENLEPELNNDSTNLHPDTSPYEVEEVASKRSRAAWLKSRGAKIAAIAVGGSLALGAAFAGGVVVTKTFGPHLNPEFSSSVGGDDRPFPQADGGQNFDHDGDGDGRGQRPPRDFDGDSNKFDGAPGGVPTGGVPTGPAPTPTETTAPTATPTTTP